MVHSHSTAAHTDAGTRDQREPLARYEHKLEDKGAPSVSPFLNLGSGAHPQPAFVNIDIVPAPGVVQHDVRRGIPFPDNSFELVYHSTMLSVLRRPEAVHVMRECHRVLKPGGVLRVVTENFEDMCRVYLEKVEAAWNGEENGALDHEWMLLEFYDQANRERMGGEMADFVSRDPLGNEDFICSRVGVQGRRMIEAARRRRAAREQASPSAIPEESLVTRARRALVTMLLGEERLKSLELGQFRRFSGQVTYRMYDRFSLRQLFQEAGFATVSLHRPDTSGHPGWNQMNLDLLPTGEVARPHCLIMEGVKA